MLRIEKKNAESPIEQKPRWIRNQVRTGPGYEDMKSRVAGASLHTVCQEAGCPNIFECWEDREATFLIGGDICTRRCDFCDITSGKPRPLDMDEPQKVAENIREMDLRYATVIAWLLVEREQPNLPEPDDLHGMACIWRQVFQPQGRLRDFLQAWQHCVREPYQAA